jgi:hypothetical protein
VNKLKSYSGQDNENKKAAIQVRTAAATLAKL